MSPTKSLSQSIKSVSPTKSPSQSIKSVSPAKSPPSSWSYYDPAGCLPDSARSCPLCCGTVPRTTHSSCVCTSGRCPAPVVSPSLGLSLLPADEFTFYFEKYHDILSYFIRGGSESFQFSNTPPCKNKGGLGPTIRGKLRVEASGRVDCTWFCEKHT